MEYIYNIFQHMMWILETLSTYLSISPALYNLQSVRFQQFQQSKWHQLGWDIKFDVCRLSDGIRVPMTISEPLAQYKGPMISTSAHFNRISHWKMPTELIKILHHVILLNFTTTIVYLIVS